MSDKYILDDLGNPVKEPDLMAWGRWMQKADRRVLRDEINGSVVSTVFLGIDHSWVRDSPLLWETMVFGGSLDQEQDRCGGSREQAEAMHAEMCKRVSNQDEISA